MKTVQDKIRTPGILPKEPAARTRQITAVVPAIVILLALGWLGYEMSMDQRTVLFRYMTMIFSGVMAFITPHILFPDKYKAWIQQLNLLPRHLFLRHLARLFPLWLFSIVALLIIVFFDPNQPLASLTTKAVLWGTGFIAITGIMMYALYRYVTIGDQSQHWYEGKSGEKLFQSLNEIGINTSVNIGMFPTFKSTILVTATGMMTIVISAAITPVIPGIIPFILLAAYAGYRLHLSLFTYDRLFYQSDAFYDELFTNPTTGTGESRTPASYDAVYWVPNRWRPAVWSQLIQIDRKRPIGRLVALFVAIYWLLIYLGVPESWQSGWMVFWIMSKNMLVWPVSDSKISPPVFQWWMMSPSDWTTARFFLQLRWTPTVFLAVGTAALFSAGSGWMEVLFWTSFDIVISAISAYILTRNNEFSFQNRYL